MCDDQHAGIEQDDIPLCCKHLEVIDRRSGGQHNALGVLDEALIIAAHAQLVVEQPRRHRHFAEAVGVDYVQREHSFVCHAPSPREREVIIRRSPPRTHRVADRLLEDFRVPPERFATAAAPDLQRGVDPLLEAIAKLILR